MLKASISARSATVLPGLPISAIRPVGSSRRWDTPELIQGGSHLVGSAELLETGFRMHVEVAAEGNGFIFDLMGFFLA